MIKEESEEPAVYEAVSIATSLRDIDFEADELTDILRKMQEAMLFILYNIEWPRDDHD